MRALTIFRSGGYGKGRKGLLSLLAALFICVLFPASSFANPQGGTVVSGAASFATSGNTLDVDQTSQRAVINWNSFNIAPNETTNINTPGASSISVDRVTGGDPAQIYGTLKSNGQVILLDPNGVFFEKGSTVDTNGIIASTGQINTAAFMSGQNTLAITGMASGTVQNQGLISVKDGGLAALVAPQVLNSGVIQANLGQVTLASGSAVTVDLYGDKLVSLAVTAPVAGALVSNSGNITAQGGSVLLTARAAQGIVNDVINMSGVINAQSFHQHNGKIVLDGGSATTGGKVTVSGTLNASGHGTGQTGGSINITGNSVELQNTAVVNASGNAGGGTINIGGDLHGQGALADAATTTIDSGAQIKADALSTGNGGQVVVWSNDETTVNGSIEAQGGTQSGNGGFVETSSHGLLNVSTPVDTSAPHGTAGEWLLDPASIIITNGTDADIINCPACIPDGTAATSMLNANTIDSALNAGTNVTITTGGDSAANAGDITVGYPISTTGSGSLTLSSYHDIVIYDGITLQGGNLTLRADNAGLGSGFIDVSAPISTNGGNITMGGGAGVITAGSGFAYGSVAVQNDIAQGDGVLVLSGVNAGGGNIIINGEGVSPGNIAGNYNGVEVDNGPVTTTGTGTINIRGIGGMGTVTHSYDYGVSLIAGDAIVASGTGGITINGTGGSSVAGYDSGVYIGGSIVANGNPISVTGTGGGASYTAAGQVTMAAYGVEIDGTVQSASGTGSISINGTGGLDGCCGASAEGVYIYGGGVNSANGNISVMGTGGITPGGVDMGIYVFAYGSIAAGGAGTITLSGTGAPQEAQGFGIEVNGGQISTVNGNLTVSTAQGSTSYGFFETGHSVVQTTGSGNISITASGGGTGGGYGFNETDYSIVESTGSGNISIMGMGAGGTQGGNVGIYVDSTSSVQMTGAGTVSLNGTGGGSSGGGGGNHGVDIEGSVENNSSNAGGITIVGYGGFGSNSPGVVINGTVQTTGGGSIFINGIGGGTGESSSGVGLSVAGDIETLGSGGITLNGTGGGSPGSGSQQNYGIFINGGIVSAVNGNLTVTAIGGGDGLGTASGDNNYGFYATAGGIVETKGTGAVSVTGSGGGIGGGSSQNYGVYVTGSSVIQATGDGGVSVTGTGGATGGGSNTNGGVFVAEASILANGGNIIINGQGETNSSTWGVGIDADGGGLISTTGTGAINIQGTGLHVQDGVISAENGNIVINTGFYPVWLGGYTLPAKGIISDVNGNIVITGESVDVYGGLIGAVYEPPSSIMTTGSGNIILNTNELDLTTAISLDSTAGVTISPLTAGLPASIGSANGEFYVADTQLVDITWGTLLTIGGPTTGNMTIGTNFSFPEPVLFQTGAGANITLLQPLTSTNALGTSITLASGQNFINDVGAGAINPGGGHWLSYSTDPADDTINGLTSTFVRYSCTFDGACPSFPATGNGFLYSYTPLLTATPSTVNTWVGGSTVPSLAGYAYTLSGYRGDDTLTDTVTGSLNGTTNYTVGAGIGAYSINYASGSLSSALGYGFVYANNASGLLATPYAVAVTANALSKVYGSADPALTYTYNLLENNDQPPVLTGSLTRVVGETVGTYAINQGTLSVGPNYAIVYTGNNLTITPYALTVAANAQSKAYASVDPALAYTYGTLQNGDTASVFSGTLTRTAGENVGTYGVNQGTLSAGPNYTISYTGNNLTITPYLLTVTANAQTKVYGSADPALTYSYGALQNDDTASVFTGGLARAAGENVGTYAINQSTLSAGPNYTVSYTGNNLTITPYLLTVTANAQSRVYGSNPPLIYTYGTLQNGDRASVFTGALSTTGQNVGTYAISQGSLNAGSNYTISYTGNNLTITPASLKITANNETMIYGGAMPVLTASYTGLVNGDTAASLTRQPRPVSGTVATANAGTYNNTITVSGAADANYTISYAPGTLTVNPYTLDITANAVSKVYGTIADPALTYIITGGTSLQNGNKASIITGALTRVAGQNAGAYAINQGTLSAGPNYTISYTGNNLTITPYQLTVSANVESKVYGAADPALTYTYSKLQNGDTAAVFTGGLSRVAGENTGTYAINQGTLSAGANYTISYTGNNLTITPFKLTVTAIAQSKVYGSADPALTYTYGTLQNGDTASVFTGALARVAGENVGTYAIKQGTLEAGANYTISYTGNNLTITPYILTVTANAQTKVYGSTDPALTYTYGALQNGDTASVFSGSLYRTPGQVVGSYAINEHTLSAGKNYTIVYVGNNLTITPYNLTISANAISKVYGAADPALTFTHGTLQDGDGAGIFTGSMTRVAGQNVGTYTISQGRLSAGPNYTITFTGNSLTITPYALSVKANAQSITYGATDPALTYTYGKLQNGDAATIITGGLTRAAGENVGTYAISQGTLSAGSNYTISYTGNNLTITPYKLTVTANAQSEVYGSADPALTYTYGTLQNGDTASVFTGALARAASENVGAYAIKQGTLSAGTNYTIGYTGNNLTITPYVLTVTANAQTKVYGSADPALTYTYGTLQNGDTAAVFTGSLYRTPGQAVGSYSINEHTFAAGRNYTISYTSNNLTITP